MAVDCWKPFTAEIRKYRQDYYSSSMSFMYSSERFGIGRTQPTDWKSLRETLESMYLELIVVVTYRRYYEWMLSSKLHVEKWTGAKPKHNRWPNHGGLAIAPNISLNLTPGEEFYFPFRYTDFMLSMIQPHVPQTKILNLHDAKSITSSLLCDVVPNTKRTCKSSLGKDHSLVEEVHANTQDAFRDSSKGRMQTITFYDVIATTAAEMGLVNTTLLSRREAGLKCQYFHQQVLNKTLDDLPLQCPSLQHLESLLDESLAKEKDIAPDFYGMHQEEHRANFWKSAYENKFCIVDAAAVLTRQRWKEFVVSLGNA